MLKVPELGSIDWIDLQTATGSAHLSGVSLGVKYVGGKTSRAWSLRSMRISFADSKRIADLRKDTTEAQHPELFAKHAMSLDAMAEWSALIEDVISECVEDINGVEGCSGRERAQQVASSLELGELLALYYAILKMQSLEAREIFTTGPSGSATG